MMIVPLHVTPMLITALDSTDHTIVAVALQFETNKKWEGADTAEKRPARTGTGRAGLIDRRLDGWGVSADRSLVLRTSRARRRKLSRCGYSPSGPRDRRGGIRGSRS